MPFPRGNKPQVMMQKDDNDDSEEDEIDYPSESSSDDDYCNNDRRNKFNSISTPTTQDFQSRVCTVINLTFSQIIYDLSFYIFFYWFNKNVKCDNLIKTLMEEICFKEFHYVAYIAVLSALIKEIKSNFICLCLLNTFQGHTRL